MACPITPEVRLPLPNEPAAVTGLVSGRAFEWSSDGGHSTIRVPELGLFEALRIEHA